MEAQTLFFNDHCITTEEQFCDAIESANPVIFVHSLPSIQIYLKCGWILKSLTVFAFYPIRFILYLSLDVLSFEIVALCVGS